MYYSSSLYLRLLCLLLCVYSSHGNFTTPSMDVEEDHDHCHDGHCKRIAPLSNYKVWLAGSGAIAIISICGIFGVLVIPIMHKVLDLALNFASISNHS
jgi:hypothetical protein